MIFKTKQITELTFKNFSKTFILLLLQKDLLKGDI